VLRPHGLSVGAGVVVLFPADACGPGEVSRVLDYLAAESAGQCGPCIFGLPALAKTYRELVAGKSPRRRLEGIGDLSPMLERRGGCSHPDGTLRFTRSALDVFEDHLSVHHQHGCTAQRQSQVLPIPKD
jgi:NADH:ubiquinone oxidoreductase subunit F (NADH-binding)